MKEYQGSCHCGAIRFTFVGPETIDGGLRVLSPICCRKGAMMGGFVIAPEDMHITVADDALAT